jgi:hypothetical protein
MTREQLRVELDFFCGCGDPEAAARALLAILDLHPLYGHHKDFWEGLFGHDGGMGYLVLYFIDSLGLTEHGGSIGGAWLTAKGEALRDALRREQQLDDFESLWPDMGPCIHGYDVEGENTHNCHTAPEPVKWDREGPKA